MPRIGLGDPTTSPAQNVDAAAKTLMAADGLLHANLFKLAADEYRQFLQDNPHHPQATAARFGLAVCHYHLGEFDQALPLLLQVLDDNQFPQKDQTLIMLGYCELAAKKYDDVLTHLGHLIDSFPDSPYRFDAVLLSGQALEAEGKPAAAVERYRQLLAVAPPERQADAHYALGVALFKAGNLPDAVTELSAAADSPSQTYAAAANLQLGLVKLAMGKTADARTILSAIPGMIPRVLPMPVTAWPSATWPTKNSPRPCPFSTICAISSPRRQICCKYNHRAVCLMELSKFEQAAKDFDQLADQSPQALYRAAYCLHQLGQYQPSHDRCHTGQACRLRHH